jgi:hypothetical protein
MQQPDPVISSKIKGYTLITNYIHPYYQLKINMLIEFLPQAFGPQKIKV